jgi:hypothetical protein
MKMYKKFVKTCEQKMVLRMQSTRKIETLAKIKRKESKFFRVMPTGLQGFDLGQKNPK